jgi:hypothetical protein
VKNEYRFRIGDWVSVKAVVSPEHAIQEDDAGDFVGRKHEMPLRERNRQRYNVLKTLHRSKVEGFVAQVTGAWLAQTGRVKPGEPSYGECGSVIEPGENWLEVTATHLVWRLRQGLRNKEYLALDEDVSEVPEYLRPTPCVMTRERVEVLL